MTLSNKPIPKSIQNHKKKQAQTNITNQADRTPTKITFLTRRPTKMTLRMENLIEYNTPCEKENEKQLNTIQTNTKRHVNWHLPNNQNITERKKQRIQTQNRKSKEEYWVDNLLPKLTEQNFPTLTQNNNTGTDQQTQDKTTKKQDQPSQSIAIVKETPISQQLHTYKTGIEFLPSSNNQNFHINNSTHNRYTSTGNFRKSNKNPQTWRW